jgi:diguanylate cyclase (GGDEF)-like protein
MKKEPSGVSPTTPAKDYTPIHVNFITLKGSESKVGALAARTAAPRRFSGTYLLDDYMQGVHMEELIELCIELDQTAIETYGHMATACADPKIRTLFEQMGTEETVHVEWWTELLDAWNAGLVPPVSDEAQLLADLKELAADIRQIVPVDCSEMSVDEMLSLAAHLEFYMLDPAFAQLIDLVRPNRRVDVREAYSRHIMRLVDAIEQQQDRTQLSNFLAQALSRALRDQTRLTRLATQDPLTGLYNRRGFYGYVRQWASWAARYGHPVSVLVIDVDRFKTINDTFGHPAGDEVLRTIAGALREAVRTSDLVGRYGGDEFAVLAPETGREELEQLMERVLEAIRGTQTGLSGDHARLSVSIGGSYAADGVSVTPEQLLAAADMGLYEAKAAGRNRAGAPRRAEEV